MMMRSTFFACPVPLDEHKAAEVRIYDCLQKIELEPRVLAGSFVLSFIALPAAYSFETFKSNLGCFHLILISAPPLNYLCLSRSNCKLTHSQVNERALRVFAKHV